MIRKITVGLIYLALLSVSAVCIAAVASGETMGLVIAEFIIALLGLICFTGWLIVTSD